MKCSSAIYVTVALVELLAASCRAGDVADYLTKEGTLKASVVLKSGAIEFLAPPGDHWVIEPSGAWTEANSERKGQLSSAQIAALAHHLAAQDFKTLPPTQGFATKSTEGVERSHRYVVISFGEQDAAFNTNRGESRTVYLPKPGDPQASAWSRFIALELILADIFRETEVIDPPETTN